MSQNPTVGTWMPKDFQMHTSQNSNTVRVAIIDLYDNQPNQGMRGIKSILADRDGMVLGQQIVYDVFETRYKNEIPGTDYDIYISSGGPGSPYDGEGKDWERNYFNLVESLWNHNQMAEMHSRKHMFFICHSFQMMCRFFKLAEVTKRKSTSFGILPVHKTDDSVKDEIFRTLPEPFHVVDSRDWQAVRPDEKVFNELGAKVLAMEKIRPHVDFERALMAIRVSDEFVGTQFHPEADPVGMSIHFQTEDRRNKVIETYGEQKYSDMLAGLDDPDKIRLTYRTIVPGFINRAIHKLRGQ